MKSKIWLAVSILMLPLYYSKGISLDEAVNIYALRTSAARAARLNYANSFLEYDNYRLGFLPSLNFGFSPIGFNNSLRLLQDPATGAYTYVKDNANTSSANVSVSQKIGLTGGTITASSSISLLREFTDNRNSYSTSPLYLSYMQPLRGNRQQYRLNKAIQHLRHELAQKTLCTTLSDEQQKVLALYLKAYAGQLQYDMAKQNVATGDTLLRFAKLKLENGYITEYDYNQIELQQLETRIELEDANRNMVAAIRDLSTELGLPDTSIEKPDARLLPAHLDQALVLALIRKNNPHVLTATLQRRQAELSRHMARMETRFNGNISLNYGLNQYAPTFAEAWSRPDRRQAISVTFSIPAFQWGINRNKRRMADNSYETTMIGIEKSESEFENRIKSQIDDYNHSCATFATAERSHSLSMEQYRMAVKKFGLGKISVYELTSAYRAQISALQRFHSALQSLYSQYYALRHVALYDFVTRRDLDEILS